MIDRDTASPGPRRWDLAYLGYGLVPLTRPDSGSPLAAFTPAERRHRLDLLIMSYGSFGIGSLSRGDLIAAAVHRVEALADFTARRADPARNSLAHHVAGYRADLDWLRRYGPELA